MEKKKLVIGFTGGIGRAVAKALSARGEQVVAFGRSAEKMEKYAAGLENISFFQGDAGKPEDIEKAMQDVSHAFYCVNIPYMEWEEKAERLLSVTVEAAIKNSVKVVFPGNVYVYGERLQFHPITEAHPHSTHTKKGRIRDRMEKMMHREYMKGRLAYTTVRMPDFYGPWVINGFYEQFFVSALQGKKLKWYGSFKAQQEFIYIEDGGEGMVTAGLSELSNGMSYNLPGYAPITAKEFLGEIAKQGGKGSGLSNFNLQPLVKLVGAFDPLIKEFAEVMYLKQRDYVMKGELFRTTFGTLPATPYEEGIAKTFEWVKQHFNV